MTIDKKKYINYFNRAKTISDILVNKLKGEDSDDKAIEEWLKVSRDAHATAERLSKVENVEKIYSEFSNIDSCHYESRRQLLESASQHLSNVRRLTLHRYILGGVSAVAAILITALFILPQYTSNKISEKTLAEKIEKNGQPTLILANGVNVDLMSKQRIIAGDETIITDGSGKLIYTQQTKLEQTARSNNYHTLVVPRSFTYSTTLSDSTVVTLNAESELKYPANFGANNREVFLKGEAYFKVKKSTVPFIVNSHGMKVKVYGTEFNINATNINFIKTVLIKGSVGVSFDGSEMERVITPNQMIVVDIKNQRSNVTNVDPARHIAWLNGYFRFDGETLNDALAEFSKWYNVEFEYSDNNDKDIKITASFEKASKLDDILLTIGSTTKLEFIKEGGKYRVGKYRYIKR